MDQVVGSTIIKIALEIALAVIIVILGLTCAVMISNDILRAYNQKIAKKTKILFTKKLSKDELDDLAEYLYKFKDGDKDDSD